MKKQIILVDLENVQPDLLPALRLQDVSVLVFVGPQQTRLAAGTAMAMQELGDRARYVQVQKQGPNALDMVLSFHMGRLSRDYPDAFFHIVSKDRDYDALLAHMKAQGVACAKAASLDAIPLFKRALAQAPGERTQAVLDWLKERGKNRPASLKTLQSSLKSAVFADRLDDAEIAEIVEALKRLGHIKLVGKKVTYLAEPGS